MKRVQVYALLTGLFFLGALPAFSSNTFAEPTIDEDDMSVETFVEGLLSPTSMAFVEENKILVLEKEGKIRLVSDGQLLEDPILTVPVSTNKTEWQTESEQGLLGIAVRNPDLEDGSSAEAEIFLFYTEIIENEPIRNRIYKYDWNGTSLKHPSLLLDLPALPGPEHNGGKLAIGHDGYLYAVIGDVNRNGKLQNNVDGPDPDDTGVIFRVHPENGTGASDNPFSSDPKNPLSRYYAYGIRNSYGIDFDPVTGNLWDTENGPEIYDEVNLVKPGFNSGWKKVMGPLRSWVGETELVNVTSSHYSDPMFTWGITSESNCCTTIGVTDIEFIESSRFGEDYENNVLVGDYVRGNLYYFELNPERDGFVFEDNKLSDSEANSEKEIESITLGTGFAGITDIETGPDGLIYVLSIGDGRIYRISDD